MTVTLNTITVTHTEQPLIRCTAKVDMPEYGIVAGQVFLLQRIKKNTYAVKHIAILDRRELTGGSITFTIRNGEDRVYHPTLHRSKYHTCDCDAYVKGRTGCYHVFFVRSIENEWVRVKRATEAANKARAQAEARRIREDASHEEAALVELAKRESARITDVSQRGSLNGNRPFSILKTA